MMDTCCTEISREKYAMGRFNNDYFVLHPLEEALDT